MIEITENTIENPVPTEPEGSRWGRAHHVLLGFLLLGLVVWLLTGVYQVGASEISLVERMGSLVANDRGEALPVGTGLHYGLPWPIDIVHRIPTGETRPVIVRDFNSSTSSSEELKKLLISRGASREVVEAVFDPYLITADKNVLNAELTLQYRIIDSQAFLLSVAHSAGGERSGTGGGQNIAQMLGERETLLAHVAAHVLIKELGNTKVDDALFMAREKLINKLLAGTRREAERLQLGVDVTLINLQVLRWPLAANDAFEAVIRAKSEADAEIAASNGYASEVKTKAEMGDAKRIVSEAKSYADKVVAQARGQVDRFNQVYSRYRTAPETTMVSLYADTMSGILKNVPRTMYVRPGQKQTLMIDPPTPPGVPR